MAFPTTGLIADFNYGSNHFLTVLDSRFILWDGANDSQVNSNEYSNVGASGAYVGNTFADESFGPDCEVYVTLSVASVDYLGIIARAADPTTSPDGYKAGWSSGDTLILERYDNNVPTQLGSSATVTQVSGMKLGLECIGSAIKAYTESGGTWTERLSQTDAVYGSAGFLALDYFDPGNEQRLDDFSGGTVVEAGATSLVYQPARPTRYRI